MTVLLYMTSLVITSGATKPTAKMERMEKRSSVGTVVLKEMMTYHKRCSNYVFDKQRTI